MIIRMPLSRQEGFSLVEVMVALAIFAIGLLSIAAMQVTAIRGNSSARRLSEATSLLQDVAERVLEEPYVNTLTAYNVLPAAASYNVTSAPSYSQIYYKDIFPVDSPALDQAVAYTVSIYLQNPGDLVPPMPMIPTDALRVTVTVSWQEGGRQRNVPVSLLKSQNMESSYVSQ
ncbi:MAG: hypothetical protein BWK76_15370 [Desulfobulbaceae bacterium A2]|nr:MAG: hypothetical protein BWK76_15370 [Desulfobulbaceae bacterium A2]